MGETARRLRRVGVALASMTAAALVLPAPAQAVSPVPITCTAAGTLETVSGPEITQWKLVGGGSCQGDLEGTYVLPNLLVQGTSDSIGLCDDDNAVVTNLRMTATGTLLNLAAPLKSKTLAGQVWGAPVTTYPVTTPFGISDAGGRGIGAGTVSSRVVGRCPLVGGSPAMTVQFTFLT